MAAIEPEEWDDKLVEPLLPAPPGDTGELLPLDLHPAVVLADDECHQMGGDNVVHVVDDPDVHQPVVELRGPDARVVFSCHNVMQFLVLFVRNLDAYFALDIEVVDNTKTYRTFHITNSRSLARVQASTCQMPLAFGKGGSWRRVCLDVHRMCKDAFGTSHAATVQVQVYATCRLLRVFFQDVDYTDPELPPMLAVLE
ncbi:hypothetical protein H310_06453 [Aphanomyces invadans]|uniref:CFA20 domain-containing protein n=1 Tax=Aphanomyces invadans TaxID=157072 RepID=A0A024U6N6_9STRA|nr:hypothetical protein H310_06453 [Aphanomyces invadans]ETW01899.1 hypothetical protein H310_06453 [Aphanomyces invadans]|eukprot:XP_008869747.1 hypothetical protein H310_06453 [Aphanomyces invadans]